MQRPKQNSSSTGSFRFLQARYGMCKSSKGLFWLLSQLRAILVLQLSSLSLVPQHFTHLCPLCPMFIVVAGVGKARCHSQEWEWGSPNPHKRRDWVGLRMTPIREDTEQQKLSLSDSSHDERFWRLPYLHTSHRSPPFLQGHSLADLRVGTRCEVS